MRDEISKKDVLRSCVLHDNSMEMIRCHRNRVLRNTKTNRTSQESHLTAGLIDGSIGFDEFLKRQHNERLLDCLRMFLFDDADLFGDVYRQMERGEASFKENRIQSDVSHEEKHRRKAISHLVESVFGIRFSRTPGGAARWHMQTTPILVAFVEEQAMKAGWGLREYIEVVEDIVGVTSNGSGDRKTLETMEALKRLTR